MILAVTPQDAEVIKFAQIDGIDLAGPAVDRRLPARRERAARPVARAPARRLRPAPASARSSPCPITITTGVTLRRLVDDLGVLPPQVVEVIQPTPYPQVAP